MKKWADYLISEVNYDSEHLISIATRHQDTDSGITKGKSVDRLTIASDIKNGFTYITIYSGNNSWKPGNKLRTFSIGGNPYLRIDKNKAKLDYLGDLPESSFAETIQELESQPEPITEPEPPSSPRGSLPKESTEELPQELELVPEPITEPEPPSSPRGSLPKESTEELPQELELVPEPIPEPEEEEATPEQLARLEQLAKQIQELESQPEPITEPEPPSSPRGSLPKESTEELPQELELVPEPITEPEPPSSPRGSLPKESTEELPQELELVPEPITEPEPPSSPRGSLPKESTEELPQELELVPEPIPEPEEEEATPEQLSQVNDLQQQIDDLENVLSNQKLSKYEPEEEEATTEQLSQVNDLQQQIDDLENVLSNQKLSKYEPEEEEATPEQLSKVKELEKEIEKLEAVDIEHEIIQTLRKQNKKLDDIENKINNSVNVEIKTTKPSSQEAYCVKCKTKRIIKNPEETIMKNGRPAIKGICSVCECKVFRITKMKK